MRKIILWSIISLTLIIISALIYLSVIGYETSRFNSILEKKINSNVYNAKVGLNKIKIKINIKNFNFFFTTLEPNINYQGNKLQINKIDAYLDLMSIFIGRPKINTINISSGEIEVNDIKNIIRYQKPSNFKKFFLNDVNKGIVTFKLDLDLIDNKIKNYEINGTVKNFSANVQNINIEKTSFIYSVKKNNGEINNLRGLINGFQINVGNFEFENSESLVIKGSIKSNLEMSKVDFHKIFQKNILQNYDKLLLTGKIQSAFKINFDKTLKITDYQAEATGIIQKFNIKFREPKNYLFIKNKINTIDFEKTRLKVNYNKNNKKLIDLSGKYKINSEAFQKFDFKNLYNSSLQEISLKGDFSNEIELALINFNTKNKIVNINTKLDLSKNNINLKELILKDDKNKIEVKNLYIKNKRFFNLDNISIKTFKEGKYNNDFKLKYGKKIKIEGLKYDASNLTKFLDQNNESNFLKKINKEIVVNIKEISTNASEMISNYNLIGNIDKGKLSKIVSKGEFKDGKYLDISLRVDKKSKKKILEIYSDLPKPLLSNYKFFDGLSGGQLLIFSSYNSAISNTNLTIENFKVKDAPGLAKLLSLADFGGMVDAVSGDGLSFEKLEMSIEKNDQMLSLKELYAIGPSISILMDGYVDSKTGLVSLRGTMVPAKTLNKFLSKLPIVGDILIPKEIGEGLFGISFKMKGVPGEIKTTVNPIKTLTPRFIQKALKKTK